MYSGRLLLVGVDPAVVEIANRTLRHVAVRIDIEQNAQDALQKLRSERYRVILSGRDAVSALLPTIAALQPRPVLIVSGLSGNELDPEIVTMVVPPEFDAHMLVGVLLACLNPARFPLPMNRGEGIGEVC